MGFFFYFHAEAISSIQWSDVQLLHVDIQAPSQIMDCPQEGQKVLERITEWMKRKFCLTVDMALRMKTLFEMD